MVTEKLNEIIKLIIKKEKKEEEEGNFMFGFIYYLMYIHTFIYIPWIMISVNPFVVIQMSYLCTDSCTIQLSLDVILASLVHSKALSLI